MTINEETGEISIETHDRGIEGTYNVEIKASSSVPTDFNNNEFITMESTL